MLKTLNPTFLEYECTTGINTLVSINARAVRSLHILLNPRSACPSSCGLLTASCYDQPVLHSSADCRLCCSCLLHSKSPPTASKAPTKLSRWVYMVLAIHQLLGTKGVQDANTQCDALSTCFSMTHSC